jgi:mono/diheme cytochrome c family protein
MTLWATTIQQSVAYVIAAILVIGGAVWLLGNLRRAKPEVGAELELAPNRKPYYDDDGMEGPRLDRFLLWGLVSITIVAVGLPLYWLAEPGRQAGAKRFFREYRGGESEIHHQPVGGGALFAPTAEGGFNCAGCHGPKGIGGSATYTFKDPTTGKLRQVAWEAPSLNDVTLRMTDEQLTEVLTYGRPFSPMPAWGAAGGGPLNEQQIQNLIYYLHDIAISKDEARKKAAEDADTELQRLNGDTAGTQEKSLGAALFNTNCARCHTLGWSYGEPGLTGAGAFGPPLSNVVNQFPDIAEHIKFVAEGTEFGDKYGRQGKSSGRMPYFGTVLTKQQIRLIVEYERRLAEQYSKAEGA